MKKLWGALVAAATLSACNLTEKLQETVYVYVSGEVAAALSAEASVAVQERLLESLTGMDAEYAGDGKWVIVPMEGQPPLGAKGNGAVTGATVAYAPAAATTASASATGYQLATEAGPDGTTGWFKRDANGLSFYYKTQPAADLSQGWPKNIQTLYSGWRGHDTGSYKGYSWWMRNEIVDSTHVRGAWRFDIGNQAARYAGTSYGGTYDYERVPNTKVAVLVTGNMKLVNGATTREGYTSYAYGFTAEGNIESGRYYYGNGPEKMFAELPAWTAGLNPAGSEWTDAQARPGLNLYRVWVDGTTSWWKYDGTSQFCSTAPSYLVVRGGGTVTAGRTLQLSAEAYNNCNDRLKYRSFTWESEQPEIATVSDSGLVSALTAGDAVIQVKSDNASANVTISVRELDRKPAKIIVTGGSTVQAGGTLQLTANVYNKSNELLDNSAVTWQSLNQGAATVSSTGLVSGAADGTAVIRASLDGINGDLSIRVYDPAAVSSVSMSCPRSSTVVGGATVSCSAWAYNYAGTYLSGAVLTWSSSNDAVLSVDSSGNLNGLAKGSATITVTSANGKQASKPIVVYSTADVSYVVIASANGSTLQLGNSGFKLALEAKAYNYNGDEIPGVNFTWFSNNNNYATVSTLSPSANAEAGPGANEGSTYLTATAQGSGISGTFYVGTWDNRLNYITITNTGGSSISSVNVALGGTTQIYVKAYNANSRFLGYVTPAFTADSGLSIDSNGLITATGAGTNKQVTATIAKSDGSGDATDSLSVNVYDPSVVTSLTSSCTSSYTKFAGASQSCSAWAYNQLGAQVSGAPVSWYTSDINLAALTSENDAGWPATAQYTVPAGLINGGTATIRAYTNCNGAPQFPGLGNCVVSSVGSIVAKGTQDIRYITVAVVPAGTTVAKDITVTLTARAWDWQATPQEITGVPFTFEKTSGTSFSAPNGLGEVTALSQSAGSSTFRACVSPGGSPCSNTDGYSSSDTVTLSVFDEDYSSSVVLHTIPSSLSTLRVHEPFVAWAEAKNANNVVIPDATFSFTSSYGRLQITPFGVGNTMATVKFIECDCTSSSTNSEYLNVNVTSGGAASSSKYLQVSNPLYNLSVAQAQNSRLDEGGYLTLTPSVSGSLGEQAPSGTTISYNEYSGGGNFNLSGATVTDTTYSQSSLTVSVYAYDATTNSGRTFYWSFYVDPRAVALPAPLFPVPSLANGTLALEHYYLDGPGYADAQTATSLFDLGAPDARSFATTTEQLLIEYDTNSGYYGLRDILTGDIVTENIGVSLKGYVKFTNAAATYYLRSQAFGGVRIAIGGVTIIDAWSNTTSVNKTVKLTNIDSTSWYPFTIEGLHGSPTYSYGQKLAHASWSTNGTSFYNTPTSVNIQLAREP